MGIRQMPIANETLHNFSNAASNVDALAAEVAKKWVGATISVAAIRTVAEYRNGNGSWRSEITYGVLMQRSIVGSPSCIGR